MIFQIIIAIIVLSISFGYLFYQWKKRQCISSITSRGIRHQKLPSFFSVLLSKKRLELESFENIKRVGKVYGFEMFGGVNIAVAEPELIQVVLSKEFTNFPNRRKFNIDDDIFANVLSAVDLDQWKRLRAIVAPTFATGKLRRMKFRMDSICRTLIRNIDSELKKSGDQDCILNIKQFAGAFTMDTILQVAFGCQIDSLIEPNNIIIKNVKKLFNTDMSLKNIVMFLIMFSMPSFIAKIFKVRPNNEVITFFSKFSLDIIERKRKEFIEKDFSKASTFIEFLIEAEHEYNMLQQKNNNEDDEKKTVKYMTNSEMIAQCVLFFLAGYDTTATTITMALYNLALNPDKQQLAYQEVERILQQQQLDDDKDPLESLVLDSFGTKFEYINGIVNETLRMTPPATFLERRCENDFVLKTEDDRIKFLVKKDEIIQIPVWALHYNEEYFPEPENFRPERFCKETADNFPNYAYLPFGSGPRACVAKSLALLEAKMALVWLIKNFQFSKCTKTTIPVEFYNQGGFLSPKDIYLSVERR
ncbi:cytochrome P450 3A56-like [Dermatophagoides pteronyssinus]|uniref:cytochrome P450 3A56-like n=1 Tax=Dermatophagoides pteronyssinus TaxID=6956 RepID=UPI003F668BE1